MRRNYTIKRSDLVNYYDTVYHEIPGEPNLWKIIDHSRKLIIINIYGPIGGEVREI